MGTPKTYSEVKAYALENGIATTGPWATAYALGWMAAQAGEDRATLDESASVIPQARGTEPSLRDAFYAGAVDASLSQFARQS